MNLDKLCSKVNEYERVKSKLFLLDKEIVNILLEDFNWTELDRIDYKTLKTLMQWLKILYGEVSFNGKRLMSYYEKRRIQEYPQLKDVKYFPELKNLEKFTKEEIINLDNYLRTYPLYSHVYPNVIRGKYDTCKFLNDEIYEKLCRIGVLEKVFVYNVSCDCKDDKEVFCLSQKEYIELQKFFNNNAEITEEELNKLLDRKSFENEAYCYTCDNIFRVKQKEDLDKYEKVIYRMIKQADLSWDSL